MQHSCASFFFLQAHSHVLLPNPFSPVHHVFLFFSSPMNIEGFQIFISPGREVLRCNQPKNWRHFSQAGLRLADVLVASNTLRPSQQLCTDCSFSLSLAGPFAPSSSPPPVMSAWSPSRLLISLSSARSVSWPFGSAGSAFWDSNQLIVR